MHVRQIMTKNPTMVPPETTLVEAAEIMRAEDVGALPVGQEHKLFGMLTDRDIVVRSLADGRDPKQTTVRDAMTPEFVFVYEDQDVEDATRVMQQRQIRRLPVLDRQKRLVGIVSLGDLATEGSIKLGGAALESISQPS